MPSLAKDDGRLAPTRVFPAADPRAHARVYAWGPL